MSALGRLIEKEAKKATKRLRMEDLPQAFIAPVRAASDFATRALPELQKVRKGLEGVRVDDLDPDVQEGFAALKDMLSVASEALNSADDASSDLVTPLKAAG